jgi:hypothetical protein
MPWSSVSGALMPAIVILKNRSLWIAITATVIFLVAGYCLPTQPFLEAVRIIQATTSLAALVAYSPGLFYALCRRDPDATDAIALTIGMMLVAFNAMGLWLLVFRLAAAPEMAQSDSLGRPSWMLDTLSFAFITGWLPSIASVMLMTVPGVLRRSDDGEPPLPVLLITVGCVSGAGLLATLIVLATKPDTRWIVEALHPYIR